MDWISATIAVLDLIERIQRNSNASAEDLERSIALRTKLRKELVNAVNDPAVPNEEKARRAEEAAAVGVSLNEDKEYEGLADVPPSTVASDVPNPVTPDHDTSAEQYDDDTLDSPR